MEQLHEYLLELKWYSTYPVPLEQARGFILSYPRFRDLCVPLEQARGFTLCLIQGSGTYLLLFPYSDGLQMSGEGYHQSFLSTLVIYSSVTQIQIVFVIESRLPNVVMSTDYSQSLCQISHYHSRGE